ncbi:MAG TPA: hypothetical protein VFK28_06325 [Sphingomicrobium sp.]|nr:hypothetical protein [Sphingomicrobium sp.]
MTRDRALIIGIVGLIGCAVGLVFAPRDTLIAWLVCWLGWGSIPIGALALLMLVALIPGTWRRLYARPLALGATLVPLVAVAMIPLLIGVELIYPWTAAGATTGYAAFKALWLSTGFFVVRTVIYLVVLSLIAWALLAARPRLRAPIAAAGVIAYALIGSLIGIDFAESTQPQFHSSIYGLLALTNQWLAGISFAILLGLWGSEGKAPLAAAGVLVTALLMWGYMHAMQYIVIWAGDIPAEARWYIERGRDGWGALAWLLYGLQGLVTFAALLSPTVRASRRAMMALAGLTLTMRVIENAWLVLPGMPGIGWPVAPLMVAASLAMLGFGWVGAIALRRREDHWNEPEWVGKARSV